MPRAVGRCFRGQAAQGCVRLDVRLADAEVERFGGRERVDLANQREFDTLESLCRFHRRASSSAVPESVFSSRYFTIIGVAMLSACFSAKSPFIARDPG